MIVFMYQLNVVSAAGGNATAVIIIPGKTWTPQQMSETGRSVQNSRRMVELGVEQVGFLFPDESRFEMAGGEFCGNAARAAALLLASPTSTDPVSVEFRMSGFDGIVRGIVNPSQPGVDRYVTCQFPSLPLNISRRQLADGTTVQVVDLKGIVHILLEGRIPDGDNNRWERHRSIVTELDLNNREAVGVIWCRRQGNKLTIEPLVWVRDVDTFYFEQACGSGSISAAAANNPAAITQPTGQDILVRFDRSDSQTTTVIESVMEVIGIEQYNQPTLDPTPLL